MGTAVILSTIGYERASQVQVLAALTAATIATVIDIRDLPLSRRAGFSKRALQAAVESAGMRYRHLKPLGTPPEGREANRRRDWTRFWQIVDAQLATPEAEHALAEAAAIAAAAPACLLCYEADWRVCHRRRVGDVLAARHGFELRHLMPF